MAVVTAGLGERVSSGRFSLAMHSVYTSLAAQRAAAEAERASPAAASPAAAECDAADRSEREAKVSLVAVFL